MEDVFRFVMMRPPQALDPGGAPSAATVSEFQIRMVGARSGPDARTAMKALADTFAREERFVAEVSSLALASAWRSFGRQVKERAANFDNDGVQALAESVFGAPADQIVNDPKWNEDRERAADSLVAIKMLPDRPWRQAPELADILRSVWLIERAAARDQSWASVGAVAASLARPILLPDALFPLPTASSPVPTTSPNDDVVPARREALKEDIGRLKKALRDLALLRPGDIRLPVEVSAPAAPVKDAKEEPASFQLLTNVKLVVTPEAFENLSPVAKTVIAELKMDPASDTVPWMTSRLEGELKRTTLDLLELSLPHRRRPSVLIGGTMIRPDLFASWAGPIAFLPLTGDGGAGVPRTHHAGLRSVGIGDLQVVRQQLKRYEMGEVAHVENVLRGEVLERIHRRKDTTEEITTSAVTLSTEEARDLQSAERFEMQRESSRTLQEDSQLQAGVSLSVSYGSYVQLTADAEASSRSSREESANQSSSYARDLTERAASRIAQEVHNERTRRVVQEVEETNTHRLTGSDRHIAGVYQWVDKVYEAQVHNYGARMLFDFVVPEPAAFYIAAILAEGGHEGDPVPPQPFELTAGDIREEDYLEIAKRYDVIDVEPPPSAYVTVAKGIEGQTGDAPNSLVRSAEIEIPQGYSAFAGYATYFVAGPQIGIGIGRQSFLSSINAGGHYGVQYFALNGEIGSVPLAVFAYLTAFSVGIEIVCQRQEAALEAWRIKTHGAILQGYLRAQTRYEDQMKALRYEREDAPPQRSPAENRALERAELKKLAISVLTQQHFDLFGAIENGRFGMPQPKLSEVDNEGKYIRFFEQAFEWEQMMYLFYPYYWSRKSSWADRVGMNDKDLLHAEFLKAGAARLVVPVRTNFDPAVAHFLETGDIWNGGELPELLSPLYLSIVREIKDRQEASKGGVPEGQPWEVRLPTTLVKLRNDDALPQWEKDESGEWRPVGGEIEWHKRN